MNVDNCPDCGVSFQGEPIPEKYRVHQDDCEEQKARWDGRCFCFPCGDATHFRREIGFEDPYVYDGILYWFCPDCGFAWPRWTTGRLGDIAAVQCAARNDARDVAS